MADTTQDLCGTLLGERYRIIKVLGEGGMGAVYLAEDNDIGRLVAIKVLRENLQDTPALARRLEMECTLLAQLGSHPNIVTLLDRQNYDNKTVLVMEYVPGEDLSDIIERTFQRTPFQKTTGGSGQAQSKTLLMTPRNAIVIAMQCLKALDYAHSKGVLHRDIKPSNIMVHKDDTGNINAKLMDFGIAKTLRQSSVDTAFTRLTKTEDRAPGTPAYMAPEQIEPDRFGAVGPGTDIYAFGVMFFEMLTGQLPFVGGFTELMHAHTNVRPPSPREINPLIKSELAHVVIRAMQKSPANRFKSAGEMLEALQTAVGLSTAEALHADSAAKMDFQEPDKKKKTRVSFRTFLLLVLFGVLATVMSWQGYTFFWMEEAPAPNTNAGAALTPEQARTVCLTFKEAADQEVVHKYAKGEWVVAEQKLKEAEEAQDPAEAVRLYTEAGREFNGIPLVAFERERKQKEETEALAAAAENQNDQNNANVYKPPEITDIKQVDLGNGMTLEMVWVQPGGFLMGSRGGAAARRGQGSTIPPDETPPRPVKITRGFWMGRYEVTQAQWAQIMGNNPSRFKEDPSNPVEQVSWNDCAMFIERLNQSAGEGVFRLPTEAEWEYACRAGSTASFHFGNDLSMLSDYAWHAGNSGAKTQPVGGKRPNAWGIHDMHGNVAEWVQDFYDPEIYKSGSVTNPYGPDTGVFRVRRGGAWSYHFSRLRSAVRDHELPDVGADVVGFRVVFIP
jgi:serine/threonine protein kinase/formylglycine-generating enzyme required for sulfatase activity